MGTKSYQNHQGYPTHHGQHGGDIRTCHYVSDKRSRSLADTHSAWFWPYGCIKYFNTKPWPKFGMIWTTKRWKNTKNCPSQRFAARKWSYRGQITSKRVQNLHIACTWHVQLDDVIKPYHSSQDKKLRFLVVLNSGDSWPHSWLATCLSKHPVKFGSIWTTNDRSKHQKDDRTRRSPRKDLQTTGQWQGVTNISWRGPGTDH